MTRHDEMLPPDVEADVAALLARALHGDEPVDVPAVVAGTRRGVLRAAVRRRLTVAAAAVAAVAVPVSVALLGPGGPARSVGPAGTVASSAARSADGTTAATPVPDTATGAPEPVAPSVSPSGGTTSPPAPPTTGADAPSMPDLPAATVVPLASLPGDDDPHHVAYLVPDDALLNPTDFPKPLVRLYEDEYRWVPTVPGQACGSSHTPMPVAARQVSWAEENSNRLDQLAVTTMVTGWKPGTGKARFADIAQGDGPCRWIDRPRPVSTAGMPGDEAWAAGFPQNNLVVGRAAIRVGDVVVAVEVFGEKDRASAVARAKELAVVLSERVVWSGLTKTAAAGG